MLKFIDEWIDRQIEKRTKAYKQKLLFLYAECYKYYLEVIQLQGPNPDVLELPFTNEKLANYNALRAVARIAGDKRVDECYSKRKKQLAILNQQLSKIGA